MLSELKTTIQQIHPEPGQRLLVMSDIHGHLNRLIQLLKKMDYSSSDILIIVGDLIEKGPESLRVVQYVMDLSRRLPVYVTMGNVDLARLELLLDDSDESGEKLAGFLHWSKNYWGCSLLEEMLSDLGVSAERVTAENACEYRRQVLEHFRGELDFLKSRPTILTAGNYLFVHGGVPTEQLSELEGTPAAQYLKNDNFWSQGHRFESCTVVTGHWPVCLYRPEAEDMSPLFDPERRIICIDGGCGLKKAGQLNGLIIPHSGASMEEITWTSFDDFPFVTAQEAQREIPATVHLNYFDNQVEPLSESGSMGVFRQLSTGKTFEGPLKWHKQWGDGEFHFYDYSDGYLSVEKGERLSVLFETDTKRYVKNSRGQLGWYGGRTLPKEAEPLVLVQGSPKSGNWRRERELNCYRLLDRLGISFSRIEHHEANTMEVCSDIDAALNAVICKNLFLCNQQRTKFYLLMMPGDKRFKTKELSKQINSARLSFGEAVYMEEYLRITPGSVSVMGLMNDAENRVQLLIDRDVLSGEWIGCHPCMNTASIRLRIKDLLEVFLPAVHHEPVYVEFNFPAPAY